jgi:hypothetical protein
MIAGIADPMLSAAGASPSTPPFPGSARALATIRKPRPRI